MKSKSFTLLKQTITVLVESTGSVSTIHSIDGLSMLTLIVMLSKSKWRMNLTNTEDQAQAHGQKCLEAANEIVSNNR